MLHRNYMLMPLSPRIDLSYLTIGTGITTFRAQAVFKGESPTQVVVAMVDGRNFLGDYKRSLYHFQHFNLNEIWFTKNGVQILTQGYVDVGLGDPEVNRGTKQRILYRKMCFLLSARLTKGRHPLLRLN